MPVNNVRRRIATVGVATLGVATFSIAAIAVAAPSAFAAGHDAAAKTEYFQIVGIGTKTNFLAHGPITAGGKDNTSHDAYDVLSLPGGTLRINHPDKDAKFKQHINAKTCYAEFDISGKYTISNGTGKYKTVTGHGTYKGSFDAILERKKDGSCNENAEPPSELNAINASGPLNL